MDHVILEKVQIAVNVDFNADELLFEMPLSKVIDNLTHIRDSYAKNGIHDVSITESWASYEDNYFELTRFREETDLELLERQTEYNRKQAKKAAKAANSAHNDAINLRIEALKNQRK